MKLSVLIPVYNERYLVEELVHRVLGAPLPDRMEREVVLVDDGSTDGTRAILERLASEHPEVIRYVPHERNLGKGGAVRTAISEATGDFCVFQDADLEYDPGDYRHLLAPLVAGRADVVYGSRFLPFERRRIQSWWHTKGNRFLTFLSNITTDLNLTDMETCYKVFRTEVLKSIPIRSNTFALEPEITAKVAKRGLRVYEVPINYDGRSYDEGKKIGVRDGFIALWAIFKYFLIDDIYEESAGGQLLTDISRTHRFNRWRAKLLQRRVGHRILELGADLGMLARRLLPRDRYVACGTDAKILRILEDLAELKLGMEVANVDPSVEEDVAPFRGSMDTVLCFHVLERSDEPEVVLRNVSEVLEPGGRLIVGVPRGNWLKSPLDGSLGNRRRYGKAELEQALAGAGFRVEELLSYNRMGTLGWLVNGKLLRRARVSRAQLKAFDATLWLWRRLDRFLPWPGLNLLAVAVKEG